MGLRFSTTTSKDEGQGAMYSLFLLLDNKGMSDMKLHHFKQWLEQNEFDSDSLIDDIINGQTASNIFKYMKLKSIKQKYLDSIYLKFVNDLNMDLLSLYLLHINMLKNDLSEFMNWSSSKDYDSDSLLEDLSNVEDQSYVYLYLEENGLEIFYN